MDVKKMIPMVKGGGQVINERKEKDRLLMKSLGITSRKAFVKKVKKLKRKERVKNAIV